MMLPAASAVRARHSHFSTILSSAASPSTLPCSASNCPAKDQVNVTCSLPKCTYANETIAFSPSCSVAGAPAAAAASVSAALFDPSSEDFVEGLYQ